MALREPETVIYGGRKRKVSRFYVDTVLFLWYTTPVNGSMGESLTAKKREERKKP